MRKSGDRVIGSSGHRVIWKGEQLTADHADCGDSADRRERVGRQGGREKQVEIKRKGEKKYGDLE
jgi:hypothetical protein